MRYILCGCIAAMLLTACRYPTERLEGYEIHGIDVSHYQHDIDWNETAAQDIDFVFIKASEGQNMQDERFAYNWKKLGEKNIRRGAYHFFRPTIDATLQVKNYTHIVHLQEGDLPPVLDVEVLDKSTPSKLRTGMKTWLDSIENTYQIRPIIYTNLNFYHDHLQGYFDGYPLWIARYNKRPPLLKSNQEWQFWQYGNRGRMSGIEGDVDFNVFCGDSTELAELCVRNCTDYFSRRKTKRNNPK